MSAQKNLFIQYMICVLCCTSMSCLSYIFMKYFHQIHQILCVELGYGSSGEQCGQWAYCGYEQFICNSLHCKSVMCLALFHQH